MQTLSTTKRKESSTSTTTALIRARCQIVGGLIVKFRSKPELNADNFDGLSSYSDAVTGCGSKAKETQKSILRLTE